MIVLDGKATSAAIRSELAEEVSRLTTVAGRQPCLAVILVGGDPASQVYVRNKERGCEEAGIKSEAYRIPEEEATQEGLLKLINELNTRDDVDGILLQLPLPKGMDSQVCLDAISPDKDVDGFHPVSMGRLALGLPGFQPCTPAGVIEMLKRYDLSPAGKKSVIIGRSNIVGKPLALMLCQGGKYANSTVTICHSRTQDVAAECREADFIFAAVGIPRFVKKDWVKPGAVVIDVGINRTEDGLCGDCDYEGISEVAAAATPVPGGVGPMTIAMLLSNTVQAFKMHTGAA